jgi:hypothetical protein
MSLLAKRQLDSKEGFCSIQLVKYHCNAESETGYFNVSLALKLLSKLSEDSSPVRLYLSEI